jgi:hypothetical protein
MQLRDDHSSNTLEIFPPKTAILSHARPEQRSVSPLAATLTDLPASVANKRLTENLTPLDATLTKNRGRGIPNVSTFKRSNDVRAHCSLFALFAQRVFHNSFAINRFHTLSQKRGVYGGPTSNS